MFIDQKTSKISSLLPIFYQNALKGGTSKVQSHHFAEKIAGGTAFRFSPPNILALPFTKDLP